MRTPLPDVPIYLVFTRDRAGRRWIAERDLADCDLETTIRDIASGQIEGVDCVLRFDPPSADGFLAADVTEDVARECWRRAAADGACSYGLADFIESNVPGSAGCTMRLREDA